MRAPHDQHFIPVQHHFSDSVRCYFLNVVLIIRGLINTNRMPLPVKGEDLPLILIVKGPLRKILIRTILDVDPNNLLNNFLRFVIVNEMAVNFLAAPEEVEIDPIILHEAAGGKGCVVAADGQGVIVDVEKLVNVEVEDDSPHIKD